MSLAVELQLAAGALSMDLAFDAAADTVTAVVGPNGAGKTTLLRAIAGVVAVRRGRIVVDGTVVEDTARGVHLPPERRRVGLMFQNSHLFGHLSVLDNVAFGLRARGTSKALARREAQTMLDRVGLGEQAPRRPHLLSGGEAQRVALARALVNRPAVLLLDEPLAAVDVASRSDLRRLLLGELADYAGVRLVVTHDPVDAGVLADRIIVIEDGRITQEGSLHSVTQHPRSRWLATMVGLNQLAGRSDGHTVHLAGDQVVPAVGGASGAVFAACRPMDVVVSRDEPEVEGQPRWRGMIEQSYRAFGLTRVHVGGEVPMIADVAAEVVHRERLDLGGPVWVTVPTGCLDVYPAG